MRRNPRSAFTLVELLVVIVIICLLVAMAIPALQSSREAGRRALCQANLGRIMLGVESYRTAFELLPAGVINPDGPIRNEPIGLHQAWLIQMLPYLDESAAYHRIDLAESVYAPANAAVRELSLAVFICPSEPRDVRAKSNYAGCHHDVEAPIAANNQGVLFLNSHVGRHDLADGESYTIFAAEKLIDPGDLGWMSGTRATLRNTGLPPNAPATLDAARGLAPARPDPPPAGEKADAAVLYVGGFASAHPGGLFVGFGDASVRFIANEIDLALWQQLANRGDGGRVNVENQRE